MHNNLSSGSDYVEMPPRQARSSSPGGYAIAAFVLGIVSFVTCGPCAGIPALIFGLIELRNIRNHTAPVEGKPFALAGAILGGINSAVVIFVIIFYLIFIILTFLIAPWGTGP